MSEPVNPDAALYAAIAKMQASVMVAIKDTTGQIGQNRGYKYADLAACWEAARQPLADNDLAVVQLPGMFENGHLALTTIIVHKDGGSLSGTMSTPVPQTNPQGVGSAITYMRRYAMCAALGIIQEDDDGASAGDVPRDTPRRENTPPAQPQRAQKGPADEPPMPIALQQEEYLQLLEYMKKYRDFKLKEMADFLQTTFANPAEASEKIGQYLHDNNNMPVFQFVQMVANNLGKKAA